MANFFDFSSDKVDIFFFLMDCSGSMGDDRNNVIKGLEMYQKSFQNFPEAGSIVVCISKFNGEYYAGEFQPVSEFSIRYSTDGLTALYYSIEEGAKQLQNYIAEVTQKKGIIPRATFILFSDGHSEGEDYSYERGKRAIENLNYAGINTVFIAFGRAIRSSFGKKMGFVSTIDVDNRETLVNFLGVELSQSCKEQSKSLKSLGANFFSKAAGSTPSSGYSQTTAQALEDNWFDDI